SRQERKRYFGPEQVLLIPTAAALAACGLLERPGQFPVAKESTRGEVVFLSILRRGVKPSFSHDPARLSLSAEPSQCAATDETSRQPVDAPATSGERTHSDLAR